jgi:hypothetical protein
VPRGGVREAGDRPGHNEHGQGERQQHTSVVHVRRPPWKSDVGAAHPGHAAPAARIGVPGAWFYPSENGIDVENGTRVS